MQFKVRPFRKLEEYGVSMEGRLVASRYVFVVNGVEYALDTLESGSDSSGPYAVIAEGERDLGLNLFIRVELDTDEVSASLGLKPGCSVSLIHRHPPELINAELRQRNIDPEKVNVVVPPRFCYSVDFNSNGGLCGWGELAPDEASQDGGN